MTNRHFAAGAGLEKARTAPYRAKHLIIEFCYSVYNQRELFICLDLIFKTVRYLLRDILSGGLVPN
jgi:hypothetical protein